MADDRNQRPPADPWSDFLFGTPPAPPQQNQRQNNKESAKPTSDANDTLQSILSPFMTKDGNLDMNKIKGGVDQAMKMANQVGPALKKLGPIIDLLSKKK
ncbi:MAG TPA: YppG family protein [Bacillales bacterium]|nr:YppG family protein [Bacillales bacterium]